MHEGQLVTKYGAHLLDGTSGGALDMNVWKARRVIKEWIGFYNNERPHSALDDKTPSEAYWNSSEKKMAA